MVTCRSPFIKKVFIKKVLSRHIVFVIFTFVFLTITDSTVSAQDGIVGPIQPPIHEVATAQMTGCGGDIMPSSNTEYEAAVVVLTNQYRVQNGLLPLKRVPMLDDSGRYHATDMAVEGYFAHNSRDLVNGQYVESCTWSNRIQSYYTNWSALAENIAAGYPTADAVVKAWIESTGHRANILNKDLAEIGVGYFGGSGPYGHYWVQDFGNRRNNFPLVIDLDAPTTDTGAVTLHLHGTWQQVRLRTDDGPWSDWQPFQQGVAWQITGNAGEHTVYAEMRNGNQTANTSDSILLTQSNATPPRLSDLPDQLSFTYYSQPKMFTPAQHTLRPLEQVADGYRWQIAVDGNWLAVSPTEGTDAFAEMRVLVTSAESIQDDTTTVTISLLDSNNTIVDSHVMTVKLEVNATPMTQIYLPAVVR